MSERHFNVIEHDSTGTNELAVSIGKIQEDTQVPPKIPDGAKKKKNA